MRKLLLILSIFITSSAVAEQIPPGCYVADYYRTDDCYEPSLFSFTWYNPGLYSSDFMVQEYGEVLSTVLNEDYSWRLYAAYQEGLAKRLRKKCGKSCKKIK